MRPNRNRMRYHVLSDMIGWNGYTNILEVGVGSGITAGYILDTNPNPALTYIGIDPYKVYKGYDNDINGTEQRIASNYKSTILVMIKHSKRMKLITDVENAKHLIGNQQFDLIFIDGNHEISYVRGDLERWWPYVKDGGYLTGHDYNIHGHDGVKQAVDDFALVQDNRQISHDEDVWMIQK